MRVLHVRGGLGAPAGMGLYDPFVTLKVASKVASVLEMPLLEKQKKNSHAETRMAIGVSALRQRTGA
jgi:hypothetical protein